MLKQDSIKKIIALFKNKRYAVPMLCILIAVALLLMSSDKTQKTESADNYDITGYIEYLQKNIKGLICKLNSVDDCNVMITVSSVDDNDYVANYNTSSSVGENNTQNNTQKEYLVINNGGGDSVVVRSKKMPKIGGVLIVYDGNNDITVKKNITDAVATSLGIQSNKVFVVSTSE